MVCDHQFDCALGSSIWVGGPNWAVFWDGNHVWDSSCITIYGCRGREHNVGYIVLGHAAEERDGSANIDSVVFEGDFGRFTNSLSRKSVKVALGT